MDVKSKVYLIALLHSLRSDYFAMNAHKMLSAAMTISCLVTRHVGITRAVFDSNSLAVHSVSSESGINGETAPPLYDHKA